MYCDQSTFDYDNLPINAKAFFEEYAQEIASLRADEEEAKPIITFDTAVEPLLKSKWGQQDPYDLYTPAIEGQQTPSGCVATAMAQVMYYHQWPERGTGSVSYTSHSSTIASQSVNFDLSADFSQSVYQWDQMTDTYDANSTEASRQAVAKLLQDCGIAVQMQYGLSASGAANKDAPYALVNYFNYDKGIRMRHAYTMSDSAWVYLLKEELDAKRPMLHMGFLPIGLMGHAFACDGYNKEGYFHINWGWNGESDGYFLLTNLAPKRHGVGGGEDGANFNAGRVVVTGIQRPQSEAPAEIPYELTYQYEPVEFKNAMAYQLAAIDASHIQISMTVDNSGYDVFTGTVYAIPYDYETGKDCGEAQPLFTIEGLENTEFVPVSPSSASFLVAGLSDGCYRFRFESEDKNGVRLPIRDPEVKNMFVPYVTIAGKAMSFQNISPMSVSHVTFELIRSKNEIPTYLVSADWTNKGNQPVSLQTGLTFSYIEEDYGHEEAQEIAHESMWFDDTLFQPGETKRIGRVYDFVPNYEYLTYTSKFEEIEPQPIVLLSERLLQFVEGELDTDGSAALRVKLHNVDSEPREVQVVAKLFPKGAQQAVATAEGKIELPESYSGQGADATYTKGIGELTIPLPAGLAAGDYYALLYTEADEPIKVADSEADARIDFTLAQATGNEAIALEAEVVRQGNLLLIQAAGEVKAVRLYDVQGRLCLKGEGSTLDLSALPTGIYFLHYQLNGVAKVKKVIR